MKAANHMISPILFVLIAILLMAGCGGGSYCQYDPLRSEGYLQPVHIRGIGNRVIEPGTPFACPSFRTEPRSLPYNVRYYEMVPRSCYHYYGYRSCGSCYPR
ncbi:hypothetical protein [Desulfonatronovibrio magnus]|uniref:hypothetical protein n=1 Tax=Desulfonatronovibrio magnus TaxID=698827 RepID=UPI0012FB86E6|nr:hypothetical protein [Desulfonatronovibrio magnus]